MDNAIISVIVPVYNAAPYLRKCIDSICKQSLCALEIILVDDGSTDGSAKICDEYAEKDPRIRVLHQAHAGLSAARNNGIDHAGCDYLAFVDSDDWIEPDMLETLYNNLLATGADISTCAHDRLSAHYDTAKPYTLRNRAEAMTAVLEDPQIWVYAWNKLYKKSVFDNVRYPVGRIYEDSYIILDLLEAADKMVSTMQVKYHYTLRPDSITCKPYQPAEEDRISSAEKILAIAENTYPHLLPGAKARYIISHLECLNKIIQTAPRAYQQEQKAHRKALRKHFGYILFVAPEDFLFSKSVSFYFKVLCPRLFLLARKIRKRKAP